MTTQALNPVDPPSAGAGEPTRGAGPSVDEEMARLNLVRALRDTEMATLRVQDLTARLISLAEENKQLSVALAASRAEAAALESVREVQFSKTFRLVVAARRALQRLRRR